MLFLQGALVIGEDLSEMRVILQCGAVVNMQAHKKVVAEDVQGSDANIPSTGVTPYVSFHDVIAQLVIWCSQAVR